MKAQNVVYERLKFNAHFSNAVEKLREYKRGAITLFTQSAGNVITRPTDECRWESYISLINDRLYAVLYRDDGDEKASIRVIELRTIEDMVKVFNKYMMYRSIDMYVQPYKICPGVKDRRMGAFVSRVTEYKGYKEYCIYCLIAYVLRTTNKFNPIMQTTELYRNVMGKYANDNLYPSQGIWSL